MNVCKRLCSIFALIACIAFSGDRASAATPYFERAILVGAGMDFVSLVTVDAFDSSDPNASDNGMYSPAKALDTAVVTINGKYDLSDIGNAKIAGSIFTVGSSLTFGPNSSVGDHAWIEGGTTGIQPGHHLTTPPIHMPLVQSPFTNGAAPLVNQTIHTTNGIENYDYVFDNGDYVVPSLSGKILIRGQARVLVETNLSITGRGRIKIADNAKLEIYCAAEVATLGGDGVINETGIASKFIFFGLPSNTEVRMGGEPEMIGCIYAPHAYVSISGGGSVEAVFIGALVSRSLRVNGRANFHPDKALITSGPTWEAPRLLLRLTNHGTHGALRVAGPPNTTFTLQYVDGAMGTNWQNSYTLNLDATGFYEIFMFNSPTRFYRTVLP